MKTTFKSLAAALLAVAIVGTTATVRAADEAKPEAKAEKKAKADAPAADAAAPAKKGLPYSGTVTAIDKTAMTVTVKKKEAEKTFSITSSTKITKAGKPATLADGVVGEECGVSYLDEDSKNVARSFRFGPKPEKKEDAAKADAPKADGEKKAKKEKKTEGDKAK
jgi:ribosomal protein S1